MAIAEDEYSCMMIWFSKLLLVVLGYTICCSEVVAQEEPPVGMADSAQKAVQALGDKVVLGDLEYAFNHMYPRWQARLIKQMGKREDLLLRVQKAEEQMTQNGISIIKFKAKRATSFFRVWPIRKEGTDPNSNDPEHFIHQWLTFIPTETTLRIIDSDNVEKRIRRFVQSGYQVAITREDVIDWTFIDGSTLSMESLRSLFPSIPAGINDMKDPITGIQILPNSRGAKEIE